MTFHFRAFEESVSVSVQLHLTLEGIMVLHQNHHESQRQPTPTRLFAW